ncbi:META domain-containing protein [Lacinutrix jangbogonensis]|uniref:META domain-containing protein n=1 Tax=Lacinutrix jangbogonensis TaxID=1469557 RepID=UPI00053F1FDC|nr:META domain-containing protein [Lacinutrix jangbogonensis]
MKTTTILLFAIILNACGASNKASNSSVDNKNSVQNTLNGTFIVSAMETENQSKNLTLNFDNKTNKVSGFSGCNRFFGTYTVKRNTIDFKALASTRKMCEENSNVVETQMLAALEKTTHFEIKDNTLTLLNAKKELLSATKTTEAKTAQNNLKIEYRAHTRGSYKNIILENNTVSVQESFDVKPVAKACASEDWSTLMEMVSELNLKSMSALEAPSKAHQYDGAAIANFTVIKDGETYTVPSYDAGNPNTEIKALVEMVLKIGEKSKE